MQCLYSKKNKDCFIRHEAGFTLIELLVVITIIGLLATIVLVSLAQARAKARDATRVEQLHQISTALELYYNLNGQYPPGYEPVWTGTLCSDDPTCLAGSDASWDTMISTLETAQVLAIKPDNSWEHTLAELFVPSADASSHRLQDPSYPARHYAYMSSPSNQNYRIRAQMETPSAATINASYTGYFYWTDKQTGDDACDTSLNLYCAGPAQNFTAFIPGKPVIYLYPTHTEQVSVKIDDALITQSIPTYANGWSVLAHPDGQLTNLSDGSSYPYLFWEGHSGKPIIDKTKGAVVADKDIESFLTTALRAQGLSQSEAKEFVDYWAPRMHGKPYVYVYFMPQADYDTLIPLHVSPKPDTVIRVYMLWKQLEEPITVTPQTFVAPARKGFTVVEWGGDRSQTE